MNIKNLVYPFDEKDFKMSSQRIVNGFSSQGIEKLAANNGILAVKKFARRSLIFENNAFRNTGIKALVMLEPSIVSEFRKDCFAENEIQELDLSKQNELKIFGGFRDNKIIKVKFPKNVTNIDVEALKNNCLQSVDFRNSTKLYTIRDSAFENNQISKIFLNDGLGEIKRNAFKNNKIEYIYNLHRKDGLLMIGKSAFESNETGILCVYDEEYNKKDRERMFGDSRKVKEIYTLDDFEINGSCIKKLNESGREKLKLNEGILYLPYECKGQKLDTLVYESLKNEHIRAIHLGNVINIETAALANNCIESIKGQMQVRKIYNWAFFNNKLNNVILDKKAYYLKNSFDQMVNVFKKSM